MVPLEKNGSETLRGWGPFIQGGYYVQASAIRIHFVPGCLFPVILEFQSMGGDVRSAAPRFYPSQL